jgi:hypothetical protein
LRATATTLIYECEFATAHLDLVTVKEGRGLGSELHPVDEDRGFLGDPSNRHLAVCRHHKDGVVWSQIGAVDHQKRRRVTTNPGLARRDFVTVTVKF